MSKDEIEAKIEYQEVVGEANSGGFKPIRFSRIKYKASPKPHISIRQFQRGYDEAGDEKYFPTKNGFQLLEQEFNKVIQEYTLLPKTYVHPEIVRKSFSLLDKGEFESAVFQAFKLLETLIRKKIGADAEEIGVKLIRKAFHPEKGPLTDFKLPKSERESFANYIAGALGYYKNPCSHRDVELDYISSFDRIVVASDLLKIIDKS